jgi:serine/threonine-protein kinase RsbW
MSCLAVPSSLETVMAFLDTVCKDAQLNEQVAFALRLAGEEACTNIIQHAYHGVEPGPMTLDVRCDEDRLVMRIEDRAPPFLPSEVPQPDLTSDWKNRRAGGLGWYLIQQFFDSVEHEPVEGGGNRLEIVKNLHSH